MATTSRNPMNNPHFEVYMNNYLNVIDKLGIHPNDFSNHTPEDIISKMKKNYTNLNTLQTYLNSMGMITGQEEYLEERKKVFNEINDLKEKKEYKEYRKDLPNYTDIVKSINPDELKGFDNQMIYYLYSLLPPLRLDYADVEIIRDTQKNNKIERYNTENIVKITGGKSGKVIFYLRNYKNSKTYGEKEYILPDKIAGMVRERYYNREPSRPVYLLMTENNKPMTPKLLGDRIRRIFKYTLNDLRSSFQKEKMESGVYDDKNIYEKNKESEEILHSYNMVDGTYYIRK